MRTGIPQTVFHNGVAECWGACDRPSLMGVAARIEVSFAGTDSLEAFSPFFPLEIPVVSGFIIKAINMESIKIQEKHLGSESSEDPHRRGRMG